jgi:N-acetylmuramoyl-L-alanine amidase
MNARQVRLLAPLAALGLAACASPGLRIDRTHVSSGQDSRVQFLVLHYTWANFESSLKILTGGPVSSHYLVRDQPVEVYQLVDENRRSFHAGVSSWQGSAGLNASSIGIEIVNAGGRPDASGKLVYADYSTEQIDAVLKLSEDIIKRHNIRPDRVVGHSDIAPSRKTDPGPKFPWKRFADRGLVLWPDEKAAAELLPSLQAKLPDVAWFQAKLAKVGYGVPANGQLDAATSDVLRAFQMKYRNTLYDGKPDAMTAALLEVLTRSK